MKEIKSLNDIPGLGEKKIYLLNKLGINNLNDLLIHFPRDYIDRRNFNKIKDCLEKNDEILIRAKVIAFENIKLKNKNNLLKVLITDGYVVASLVCYNRDFYKNILTKNKEYIVCGKFEYKYNEFQSSVFEILDENLDKYAFNRIVPVYTLTEGISMKQMRKLIYDLIFNYSIIEKSRESLPDYIIKKRNLVSRYFALQNIHFPENFEALKKARERLVYYEFFELQFVLALKKYKSRERNKNRLITKYDLFNKIFYKLPFELTRDQRRAINEIKYDLMQSSPMNRLLIGDVGCGKTIIALITCLLVIENGYQVALMAPTEILANQHYKNAKEIFSDFDINIAILTSSTKSKEKKIILEQLKEGKINLIIGTHSLFQEKIFFKSLAYIIIDEQHRFGVLERVKLMNKGENSDILFMSATPIPRTLSLSLYGDLDLTFIKEKPKERKKIITKIVFEEDLKDIFDHIKDEVRKGNKAYIVYPLVEESDKIDLKAAAKEYKKIKNQYLKNINVSIVYGKMDADVKQKVMENFKNGNISVLVSTTVIETGIDVPNATIMLVEHSERYGLSTLHQLRGRIGRGEEQSYCYFVAPKVIDNDKVYSRLKILEESDDGFRIAEEDLKIRGPGEFIGVRQHGSFPFRLANLYSDREIFELAREDAFNLIKDDPNIDKVENKVLKNTLYKKFLDKYINLLQG